MNFIFGILAGLTGIIAVISLIRLRHLKSSLKKEQQALRQNKERYRLLVENVDEGVLIAQRLTIKYANKRVYEMMGLVKDNSLSRDLLDYIYPDDLNIMLETYEKTLLTKDLAADFKIRLRKSDKSILWVHIRTVSVAWEDEPAHLIFIRNITAQKMMEQDLMQAQRMEAIGALSGGIAHDFNNILTTIVGNAEVALMDLSDQDPGRDEFEQIRESGYRARDLVRQILAISREHTLDVQPLYLSPIVKEALKLLRSTLPTNIRIIQNIDKHLNVVKADSIQMYQVFMNLCTNAKHAMERGESPCLEVGLQNVTIQATDSEVSNHLKPGKYVELSVKDNGVGIDPEIEHKIFKPYFTTKNKEIRTGLGLTTTLGIVRQAGGCISHESEPGKGSCFKIHLPVHEMRNSKDSKTEESIPVQGNGKILFVDDEKEITLIAKKMLETFGFSVMTANTGKDALERFARSPEFFDLMITDLAMPGITGERLAKEVLRIRPGFPVILCTGHSDTFDEASAKEIGIMEYVTKPYNLKELSAIASKYIKRIKAA